MIARHTRPALVLLCAGMAGVRAAALAAPPADAQPRRANFLGEIASADARRVAGTTGIVYILPEIKMIQHVFRCLRTCMARSATARSQSSEQERQQEGFGWT